TRMDVQHNAKVLSNLPLRSNTLLETDETVRSTIIKPFLYSEVGGEMGKFDISSLHLAQKEDDLFIVCQAIKGVHFRRMLINRKLQIELRFFLKASEVFDQLCKRT